MGREIVSGFLMPRPGTTNASEEKKSFSNTRKACNWRPEVSIWLHVKFKDWTFGVSYTERWTKSQGQQQAKYCWRERGAFQWSGERSADVKTCCPSGVAGLQVILHCVWRWRPLEKNAQCVNKTRLLSPKTAACGCLFHCKPPIEVPQWIFPQRTALDTTLKIWPKRASRSMTCP